MSDAMIEGFRLSPQQQHVWSRQSADANTPYRAQGTILIEGSLDPTRLLAALTDVIERYEILRTTFQYLQGMALPLQVVAEPSAIAMPFYDLAGNPASAESELQALRAVLDQQPFDWTNGPLIHTLLARVAPEAYQLVVSLPTLCADNATLTNLLNELATAYAGQTTSDEPDEGIMQYIDIAEWQHELLESEDTAAGRAYWQQQDWLALAAVKPPFVTARPADAAFTPRTIAFSLSAQTVERLTQASERLNVPPTAILLAGWRALLWRLSGRTNALVGAICDGRKYAELETALGLFAKTVPLSSPIAPAQSFEGFVQQVHSEYLEAYKWQESFIWPAEIPPQLTFFPFCFEAFSAPQALASGDTTFTLIEQQACVSPYAAKVVWAIQGADVKGTLAFDATLVSATNAERLIEQYQTLLAAGLADLDTALGRLSMIGPRERQQVLVEFNATGVDYPAPACFHHLFSAQAARTPEQLAVMVEDQSLTYAELDSRSSQLARHLRTLGVGPDVPVALAMDRSINLMVGILGILKAGGAYVPLDLVLPPERLAFMLADTHPPAIVTEHQALARLPDHTAHGVCLDTDWEAIASQSDEPFDGGAAPDNLMYIIYTSGSTGQPKGVSVEHRQLYNYISSIIERLDLPATASFACVSTFAADLGHTAVFPALTQGGTVHIIPADRAANANQMAEYMQRHAIDCLKIVPSHLAALLTVAEPAQVLPRQRLIMGGEAASWNLIQTVALLKPDCQIFNHYGPTETTVGVLTNRLLPTDQSAQAGIPPLGRPIANTPIYLLDPEGQPVPIGMPGEIYIGGLSVARGYWARPAATAERFIPAAFAHPDGHPEGTRPGARLYRTGDLARYLPDGKLEFLGRSDDQVKIRGFRIELGEIEAALLRHAAIREAVVIAREDTAGEKRLVAYLVAAQKAPLSLRELRTFLKNSLPDYMIPAAFLMLEQLPLNANGKLDRRALPTPEQAQPKAAAQIVAPRTAVEETLAGIWSQVLGGKPVGIHNNFFELGGDSILSIQIIARASQVGLKLTPKQLFDHPTIAELALVADAAAGSQADQRLVTGPVPLTPIQHWFFEQNPADPQHYNQAVFFEVRFHMDPAILGQVLQHLVEHHDALRLRFTRTEAGWQQANSPDHRSDLIHIDLSDYPESEQRAALERTAAELQARLNLAEGPLIRMALFDLGADRPSRLLTIVHHLAIDSVSWQILFSDLPTAYEQISQGQPIQLPAKTTAFKRWAERLADYAQSAHLGQQLNYWLDEARQQISPIPVDRPVTSKNNTVADTAVISVSLTAEETAALLNDVPPVYNTQINDVLLAALLQASSQWSGSTALLVDLEGHGREDIFAEVDISRTIGWFTTRFPVLLAGGKATHTGEILRSVKEQLRQIPQRGIGYGLLRYVRGDSSITRQLAALPEPEISFNYLGVVAQDVSTDGPFAWTSESSGPSRSPHGVRRHLLDINGLIINQSMQINWTYSQHIHDEATIRLLAQRFVTALRAIISHCQNPEAGGYTPSDFPGAKLSQKSLDKFISKLSSSGKADHES